MNINFKEFSNTWSSPFVAGNDTTNKFWRYEYALKDQPNVAPLGNLCIACRCAEQIIQTKNSYDKCGRNVSLCQKIDADNWERVRQNAYYPIGELKTKGLGCDSSSGSPLAIQNVDYEYNIRGWLTDINKIADASMTASKDLFAMNLSYAGNFTGNITGQQWQTASKVGTNAKAGTIQSYAYQYDELNRILKADFVGSNTNGISTSMYDPTQGNKRAYDLNGNILGLHRSVNGTKVDGLTYNYSVGNRLNAVTDAETNTDTRYFTDLNKTGADYTYDAMGNMITDANKHLTGIAYNHQNLPTQIQRTGESTSGKMKYYYTGTGQKLMVEIFDTTATAPTASKTRYYLGGIILKGNDVEFVNTPEGRAVPKLSLWKNPNGSIVNPTGSPSKFAYEYHLKDHLGNLRVACRCGDPTRDTTTNIIDSLAARQPAMAVQTNDYDAWGLDFGSSSPISFGEGSGVRSRYLYNGKEQVTDLGLGLSEYGFRWYDAGIAKFVQVDPLADKYAYKSTYDYAENKPISGVDLDGLEFYYTSDGVLLGQRTFGADGKPLSKEIQNSVKLSSGVRNTKDGYSLFENVQDLNIQNDVFLGFASVIHNETSARGDNCLESKIIGNITQNFITQGGSAGLPTLEDVVLYDNKFAQGATQNNYTAFLELNPSQRNTRGAMEAAINAIGFSLNLGGFQDFSNNADGWDGPDLVLKSWDNDHRNYTWSKDSKEMLQEYADKYKKRGVVDINRTFNFKNKFQVDAKMIHGNSLFYDVVTGRGEKKQDNVRFKSN
jgi:RHS repeat-associated protein